MTRAEQEPHKPDKWRLTVAPDGRSAILSTPPGVAVTSVSARTVELRIADSETLPANSLDPGPPPAWSADLAEQILRRAKPFGLVFLRALIDEGGTATAERLRTLTGQQALHYAGVSLTAAARKVLSEHHPGGARWRHFYAARPHPDGRSRNVHDYHLPDELVPLFDEALCRLGY